MNRRPLRTFGLVAATVIALPLVAAAQTKLPSRENDQGAVMVTVTPETISATADPWRFEVQFDTHVSPITQDLTAVATLSDGKGHDEKPTAWQGDPPGGHHRRGVLVFKPIKPLPQSVTLTIREVGGVPARTFAWTLSNP